MPVKKFDIDTAAKKYLLIVAGAASILAALIVAKWTVGNFFAAGAPDIEVAGLAVWLAPDDPQSHFASAVLRERTFEAKDAEIARSEYEKAAELSSNSYAVWLALAKIREASGDRDGGRAALARARELAPNYARVRWAYGNLLLRNGETDAAFDEMRAASAADPAFAAPLVAAASQFYESDADGLRKAVGDSPAALASLSLAFANEKRFDEAVSLWQSLGPADRTAAAETGKTVLNKVLEAKKYRAAMTLANLLDESPKFTVGTVYDGGFEGGITMSNAGAFDWHIPEGPQPQVALTDGQRRNGSYALLLIFRSSAGGEVHPISQTIAVVPGAAYHFEAFYRSDLKTTAKLRWQIASADGRQLASTEAMSPSGAFGPLGCDLVVPADTDGIVISLVRDACTGPCPIAGNVWLDDISLRSRQ